MDFATQISDVVLAATEQAEYKVSPSGEPSMALSSLKTGVFRIGSPKGHISTCIEKWESAHTHRHTRTHTYGIQKEKSFTSEYKSETETVCI